ncbi:MAG: hypothetical protein WC601_02925 [Desulfotomaculaceae bacterium]
MLDQLLANQGKKIVIELVNGRKISGTVLSANQQSLRLETDEGIGNIPAQAVYIVWEAPAQTLTRESMDEIADKLRDSVKAEIACTGFQFICNQQYICRPPDFCSGAFACPGTYVPSQGGSQCPVTFACPGTQFFGIVGPQGQGQPMASQYEQDDVKAQIACTAFPGFTCSRSYICRPPDTCNFRFACPGSYVPSFPSGGGGCPSFQFGQPCTFAFQCRPIQFSQPCGPFQFSQPCGPFQFGQPCGPFQFGQPCGPFQFGQPCGPFQFGCRPFTFGGSQCGTLGGFTCGGQQFFGIAPGGGGGSQCGTLGGFTCPGQQFIGVAGPPRPQQQTQQNPPLSPLEFSVKPEGPKDDDKLKKE